jgi:hypothetical protein
MRDDPPIPSTPRSIEASGPGPDLESLRTAYLDLLKLSLCDLVGVSTQMVWQDDDGRPFSRELRDDDQRGWRVDGTDWPLNALTMVGLRRLDDLQACVAAIVRDEVEGDLIEAGAWRGGASIFMRAALNALGAEDRTVWVADSFQGFPEPLPGTEDSGLDTQMSGIDYLAPALEDVRGYFARFGCERGVEFVPGFFEQTMDGLRGRRWSLIRVDADGYAATQLALKTLYPGLAPGGYVIIDDYFHFQLPVCRRAVDDFRREHGIDDPIERIDWVGARWQKTAPVTPEASETEGENGRRPPAPRAAPRRDPDRIPTDHELGLEYQLTELRERLATIEAERPPQP